MHVPCKPMKRVCVLYSQLNQGVFYDLQFYIVSLYFNVLIFLPVAWAAVVQPVSRYVALWSLHMSM